MADITFNTASGETIARELLVAYLNTGTSEAPVWSPVGKRVEDSSIELDWSVETITDIFGDTYSTGQKATKTQTFDPYKLDGGDAALVKIWNLAVKENNVTALLNQDMLIAHLYAGAEGQNFAERYHACAVLPSSLGGAGGASIDMPIDVTYGGKREVGTIAKSETGVVFTPEVIA